MSTGQYNAALSIFFVSYAVFEYVSLCYIGVFL